MRGGLQHQKAARVAEARQLVGGVEATRRLQRTDERRQRAVVTAGGDDRARGGQAHVDVGIAHVLRGQRVAGAAELAGGVHRGDAHGGVGIVGGLAHAGSAACAPLVRDSCTAARRAT